jgi:hypothetical protein
MVGGFTHLVLVPLSTCLAVLISTRTQLYYDAEYYENTIYSFLHGRKERCIGGTPIFGRLMIYEFMALFGQLAFRAGAEILFIGNENPSRAGGFAWFRRLKGTTWSHATARCSHETINTIFLENEQMDWTAAPTLGTHIGLPFLDLSNKYKAADYWLYVNHEITRMRGARHMPLQALIDFFDQIWRDFYCFQHPHGHFSHWKPDGDYDGS